MFQLIGKSLALLWSGSWFGYLGRLLEALPKVVTMNFVNLSDCENEPLRFPGTVMPHGALVVLQAGPSSPVAAASDSCAALLGLSPEDMLGASFGELFGADAAAALTIAQGDELRPILRLSRHGRNLLARAGINEAGQMLVDIEPSSQDASVAYGMFHESRRKLDRLRRLTGIPTVPQAVAESIRGITDFDRVMVYRFDEAWNGEIIAEARRDDIEPYLGLNYPASDIPGQARELFQSCKLRLIPDVDYVPSALVARQDACGLDLGRSSLRSVSPVHIEYLKNMGVRATLVGALVVEGKLWGLLACHHVSGPKYFGPDVMEMLEWLCQDIAALIEVTLIRQRQARVHSLALRRQALAEMVRAGDARSLMDPGSADDLLNVVGADGFALISEKKIQTLGRVPSLERIRNLQGCRRQRDKAAPLFVSTSLAGDFGKDDADNGVAGAIFVSVQESPEVSIIWFRIERRYSVRWAGDPAQTHIADQTGRLSPRKSFAQFLEKVRDQCLAWSAEEMASAADMATLIQNELLRKSQALAETAMMSMPEHLAVLDDQGVILAVNRAWERFAEENGAADLAKNSVGMNYRDFCQSVSGQPDATDAAAAWAGIEAVMNRRLDRFTLDYPCHSPTEQRWFQMTVAPMMAPGEGVVVLHQNLTQRKLTEMTLSREQGRLRILLETIPDLVWLKDLEGRYVICNPAFQRFLGSEATNITGKTDYDFVPKHLADFFRQKDAEAVAAGKAAVNEEWIARDGHRVLLETIKTPLCDAEGNNIGVLGIARDITSRKTSEIQLLRTNAELEQFAYLASHDLREPLRMVSSYLGLIEKRLGPQLEDDLKTYFGFVIGGAKRMNRLITSLLEYSEIGNSTVLSPVPLADALTNACRALATVIQEADATVTWPKDMPLVLGAPADLDRLFLDLIGNAIKYCFPGRRPVVDIGWRKHVNDYLVWVNDNGMGIAPEHCERAFQLFQKLGPKDTLDGSGIGLSICKKIVERHGGRIWIESKIGEGSSFFITFPVLSQKGDANA